MSSSLAFSYLIVFALKTVIYDDTSSSQCEVNYNLSTKTKEEEKNLKLKDDGDVCSVNKRYLLAGKIVSNSKERGRRERGRGYVLSLLGWVVDLV